MRKNLFRRRDMLAAGAGAAVAPLVGQPARSIRVAAVVTEYRHWSHADVVVGRLLGGYSVNGRHREPRSRVVSMFTHQVPQGRDMSRDLAARFGFQIYPTIRETLTLGGDQLAVDAVCFVGEHGDYPSNELGQKLYPRYELFMQILDVYEKSGRAVPTFFDKHLSYSWPKAKEMYERAKRLRTPWMAGSSIPVTIRVPPVEIPLDTPLESAIGIGYGDQDAYGFHTLEAFLCMAERRTGGETGVRAVEFVSGDAVWQWRDGEGSWSKPLLEAALSRHPERKPGALEQLVQQPVLFRLEFTDGLKAACYLLNGAVNNWSFAGKRKDRDETYSCYFGLPDRSRPLPHFDGLVSCIEEMYATGKPLYPVERTLLSTGALAFLFESKRTGRRVETPELAISYRAPANAFFQRS